MIIKNRNMNKLLNLVSILLMVLLFQGCKKETEDIKLTATVNIINAAVNVPGVKVNTSGGNIVYSIVTQIAYGAGQLNYVPRTSTPVVIVKAADSTALVNITFNFQSPVYSLYLVGQSPAIENMLVEETNFPFIRQDITAPSSDSVVNVRFVNLSPNSVPVKIKINGATVNEVDNLPYKSVSAWKAYTAKLVTTNYAFQVRNAATDALLASYTFSATGTNRFKNVALIIKGLQGTTSGVNAYGVSVVNYF
jgi:hypothetical protein